MKCLFRSFRNKAKLYKIDSEQNRSESDHDVTHQKLPPSIGRSNFSQYANHETK